MVNIIWFWMIFLGLLTFILKGETRGVVKVMTDSAQSSIELLIALAGIMAVWSGIMRIWEKCGLVDLIGKILSPIMKILFKGLINKNKTALWNIIMNISSNLLGLSNAATPFGIKAMEELSKINPKKDTASDYMVTFLVVNSACIQIFPTTVVSIRASLGASNPADIVLPTILTGCIALSFGLLSNSILKRFYK